MNIFKTKVFVLLLLCLVVSCKKEGPERKQEHFKSVTILYLEGNNDLRQEAHKAINDLEKGAYGAASNSLILVYIRDNDRYGYLMKILPDDIAYRISSDTLKVFDASVPSDATQINNVLSYIKDTYESEQYNLILWSHGTAWAPAARYSSRPKARAFGEDRGVQIDILDLKNALPMKFNYIIFDACAMASVEVLYEFRDKANYIIASPTDILSSGFPYEEIVPYMGSNTEEGIVKIADTYFNHYNALSGLYRSASVSVIDAPKLEKLSVYLKKLNKQKKRSFTTEQVQRLDFTEGFPVSMYDFGSFVTTNYTKQEVSDISDIIDEAVVYKNNTPQFLGNELASFSGLAISWLEPNSAYYSYYMNLGWNKDIKN